MFNFSYVDNDKRSYALVGASLEFQMGRKCCIFLFKSVVPTPMPVCGECNSADSKSDAFASLVGDG